MTEQKNEEDLSFTVGDIIVWSEGEYSDYRIIFLAKVLKEFSLKELQLKHADLLPVIQPITNNQPRREITFTSWMVVHSGYLEEIAWKEIHCDEEEWYTKRPVDPSIHINSNKKFSGEENE